MQATMQMFYQPKESCYFLLRKQFLKYYPFKAKSLNVTTKLRPIVYCNVRKVGNHKDARETLPVLPTLIISHLILIWEILE